MKKFLTKLASLNFIIGCIMWFSGAAQATTCPGNALPSAGTRVVGLSQDGDLRGWPGFGVLRLRNRYSGIETYVCGGAAINSEWFLTAAHCFVDLGIAKRPNGVTDENGRLLEIVMSTADLEAIKAENVYPVEDFVIHEQYVKATESGNDIALVKLSRPWKGPISRLAQQGWGLPPDVEIYVKVAGFGSQQRSGRGSSFIRGDGSKYEAGGRAFREVDLPTVDRDLCRQRWHPNYISTGQICAGPEDGSKDSCIGDSGGPLVAFDRQRCPFQIGIVSWGPKPCGTPRQYGVYTSVAYFRNWIEKRTSATMSGPASRSSLSGATVTEFTDQIDALLAPVSGGVKVQIRGLDVHVGPDKRLPLGKRFRLLSEIDIEGQLIILDIDAAGRVVQLFPNKFLPTHELGRVKPGQKIAIPSPEMGFDWFRAVEPLGRGKLIAIVVPNEFPYSKMVAEHDRLRKGFTPEAPVPQKGPVNYIVNLIQQISSTLRKDKQADRPIRGRWAYGVVDYEIVR